MFKLSMCENSTELEIPNNICVISIICIFMLLALLMVMIFIYITKNPEMLDNLFNTSELKDIVTGVLLPKN